MASTDDPDLVKKAKDKAKKDEAGRNAVIKKVMNDTHGRAWIYDWLLRCHIYHTPFTPGSQDITDFNCGEQNIGMMLLADVQKSTPNQYLIMLKEAKLQEQDE
jgi:hypothetical protein